MSGEFTEIRKYRWELPEDASAEKVERDRKVSVLVHRGWLRGWDGRWLRPPFVVGTVPPSYTLDEAYLLARSEG